MCWFLCAVPAIVSKGSVSWLSLATLVHSPTAAVAAMLLGSLSTACSDVVVDSLVVERARGEPAVRGRRRQELNAQATKPGEFSAARLTCQAPWRKGSLSLH